jgi:hypothetical protein
MVLERRGGYPPRCYDDHHKGGHGRGRGYGRGGYQQVGPCNYYGAMGHLLRNCKVLSQEISKRKAECDRLRGMNHSAHLAKDNCSNEGPGQVDVF